MARCCPSFLFSILTHCFHFNSRTTLFHAPSCQLSATSYTMSSSSSRSSRRATRSTSSPFDSPALVPIGLSTPKPTDASSSRSDRVVSISNAVEVCELESATDHTPDGSPSQRRSNCCIGSRGTASGRGDLEGDQSRRDLVSLRRTSGPCVDPQAAYGGFLPNTGCCDQKATPCHRD
ncbi:hypothetical protein BC939DRAFT_456548 [Gamsiella multidivaricata]|uniref:uncharacterized protein n=1 Tax=Gamsiella multidivaricata TaxID=101098 RepID=UPI00221EB4A7|nr:uncharacterized protein BC939DRAFT_456548 [Gamsiella multidivaricata]KAI7820914.1 hypothetical protein BC939DRAFT_456548 [Gamsiella multidivaricata]